jgi:integrase
LQALWGSQPLRFKVGSLLADLTGCGDGIEDRRSARVAMEAHQLGQVPYLRDLQFRAGHEPKSTASKKPVVLHSLVMGLLKNWRETTAYAGDEDFIFASDRLKGKQPRVPNMLVEDHLRPAAKQVVEIPNGHRFSFHNLRHALTSFLVEIGTDSKTILDMRRWADPSILLKVYAHSRMDKRMEAQSKMIDAMGLNEKTARGLIQ